MVAICSSRSLMLSRAVHGSFSVPISSSSEKFVRWVLSLLHRGRSWNFERPNEPSKSPLLTGQGWSLNIVVVLAQLLSLIRFFVTPWTAACQVSLSFTISWSLLKLMSSESVMPSNHLILCCPLLLLTSIFPSIRVFSNESVICIRWPKYWSFSFSISPSNEYSRLISFRMDWFEEPLCKALHTLFVLILTVIPWKRNYSLLYRWTPVYRYTRLPCPSLSLGVCSNSCPLNQWCHPAISFSVTPFSSCPQSFPSSGSFPMSQLFESGDLIY